MAWSDAARAAALEARRMHAKMVTHNLVVRARGNVSGPVDLLDALRDQHFYSRAAAIKSKAYDTPKQWGSRPGWMARQMEGTKKVNAAQAVSSRMGKIVRRYAKKVYGFK